MKTYLKLSWATPTEFGENAFSVTRECLCFHHARHEAKKWYRMMKKSCYKGCDIGWMIYSR